MDLFYTDGKRKTSLLQDVLKQQDIGRYTIEVHGLKSAAANIGAERLSGLAKEHEEAGKAGETGWIAENASALEDDYQEILGEIGRVLKEWQFGSFAKSDVSNLAPIGEEELKAHLEKALDSLEEFESKEAAAEVEELLGYGIPEDTRAKLEQIQALLKIYEDDQAEELLRSMVR